MFFHKTKYFLVTYKGANGGFGNASFAITGLKSHLDLNYVLTWLKDGNIQQPIIVNIIEINRNQYDEFYEWAENNKNDYDDLNVVK